MRLLAELQGGTEAQGSHSSAAADAGLSLPCWGDCWLEYHHTVGRQRAEGCQGAGGKQRITSEVKEEIGHVGPVKRLTVHGPTASLGGEEGG